MQLHEVRSGRMHVDHKCLCAHANVEVRELHSMRVRMRHKKERVKIAYHCPNGGQCCLSIVECVQGERMRASPDICYDWLSSKIREAYEDEQGRR